MDAAAFLRDVFAAHRIWPDVLAVPDFRAADAGVRALAEALGLAVTVVAGDALAAVQGQCPTRSARAAAETGFASVAEGCALAAAGHGARLVVLRQTGPGVTCAVALRDVAGRDGEWGTE